MKYGMGILAAGCGALALGAVWAVPLLANPIDQVASIDKTILAESLLRFRGMLYWILGLTLAVVALTWVFLLLRNKLGRPDLTRRAVTWDCGYAKPTARMQYTASSFAQPIVNFFKPLLSPAIR